jgi:putative FmdB family regulatory protein
MPTYAYKCTECGHEFEVDHPMDAGPELRPEHCENCWGPIKIQLFPVPGYVRGGTEKFHG